MEIYADSHFGCNMTYMLRSALSIKRAVYDAWKTKSKERELNLNACTCRRTHLGDGLGLLLSNTVAVGGGAQFGMAEARLKYSGPERDTRQL